MRPADSGTAIVECRPARALVRPGQEAKVWVRADGIFGRHAHLRLTVWGLDRQVAVVEDTLHPGGCEIGFATPRDVEGGYGIGVHLVDSRSDMVLAQCWTAVDVRQSWTDAPRYAFLSEFAPGEQYEQRADELLARQVNAVQFYDWMYRHYRYLPPDDTFVDAVGRTLSLASTRRAIEALRERGIAPIAYGSVYGAEPDHALEHPEELIYDAEGVPHSLGGAFFYQDVRPGTWRDRILREYRQAITSLGFAGIQADQYGEREPVFDRAGEPVDMPAALAGMVRASQEAVVAAGGEGVIFNCVNNWPIEAIAPEPQLCSYIELWPPHVHLRDLAALVEQARRLAPERQVILAAYTSCAASDPDGAAAATLLTSAAIHAAGGFHLLLGEGDAILTDPYFPKFVRPGPDFQRRIIAHWNFVAAQGTYLSHRSLRTEESCWDGAVWRIRRRSPRFSTVSAINAHPDDLWDLVKPEPVTRTDVAIDLAREEPIESVVVVTPDAPGPGIRVPFEQRSGRVRFAIPEVRTWTLAVLKHKE